MLNGLDLFSGIGGLTMALAPWVDPVAYCELDRYCRAVLLSRMATGDLPPAPIWDDVRTLRGEALPQVDIVYGGFPCQNISIAGLGAGLEGEQSILFFEVARLVREVRPRFVFLENVAAIAFRGLDRVAGELASLGYDCRWDMLRACDVGAPHERERWWLLAHAECIGRDPGRRGTGTIELELSDYTERRREMGDSDGERLEVRQGKRGDPREERAPPFGAGWWAVEPDLGRVAHGVPKRVDRLRALGNAVVPCQAREAFQRLSGLKAHY